MAEKAAAPDAQSAQPKKKKLLLVIVIALLVGVLAAGGAAFLLLSGKPHAEQQAEEEAAEAEEEAKPPLYEKLETFTVNLADHESYLQTEISLKVADPKVQERLKQHMPEVRDALLRLLMSKTPEELMSPEGQSALAEEVRKEINRVIGAKKASQGVKQVLFTSFIIQ